MTTRLRRRITTAKREEIEAEQKILENTIVRPFETLEGLPISYNEPPNGHYEDILKNPLTIKDSAVLYNSLIRSRSTYVFHAPMFKLHWVKQTAYAKKLAEMDKEKQKEILNDRENKRRFAKATTNSLEARTRTPVLSPEVNARDVMSKLCESAITLGPHTMDIRIFIAKDARSEKSKAISELSKMGGATGGPGDPITDPSVASEGENGSQPTCVQHSASLVTSSHQISHHAALPISRSETASGPSGQNALKSPTHLAVSDSRIPPDDRRGEETKGERKKELRTSLVSSHVAKTSFETEGGTFEQENNGENSKGVRKYNVCAHGTPSVSGTSPSESEQSKSQIGRNSIGLVDANCSTDSSISKSADSTNSSNPSKSLDASTKAEPHLFSSTKTSQQPPANSTHMAGASKTAVTSSNPPSSITKVSSAPCPSPPIRPATTNLQSIENTVMISNLNAIAKIDLSLNDLMKEVASGKASEAQITRFKKYIERAKQMGPQPHHAELYFSRGLPLPPDFPRPYQARPLIEKRTPSKPKVLNPMKLTAFQERYLHNATLVFEFLENPNVRYIIPQDSICEVLKAELPLPQDAEAGSEFNDVLLSHIWVHNIDEEEKYAKANADFEAEVRRQKEEEDIKRKEEEENNKNGNFLDRDASHAKSEPRALRTKKKAPPPKKKKQLVQPEPPHIKYTAFSFTIHNIPSRYIPIFTNSMKPLKQVQERMEHILKTGTRMTSFYLWYQIDARLDETFAETLRNTAVAEEKKMAGLVPPVEQKKRKPREYKNPKAKRSKDKSPSTVQAPSPSVPDGSATSPSSSTVIANKIEIPRLE